MRTALYFLAALEDGDIGWLARAGDLRACDRDAVLIHAGDPPGDLLILLDGTARVLGAEGRPIALRRAGECLGEISFVDALPTSATVVAEEPLHLLALPRATLLERLDEDAGFAARFYRGLAILLANRLRQATGGSVEEREALDETVLAGMTRAGERFRLLGEYLAKRRP